MTLKKLYDYLARRLPIEQIALIWDATGYTSEAFNHWASDSSFSGWTGISPQKRRPESSLSY